MAPAAVAACGAWARFFFAEADDAVVQYVCQSLLSAVEEGGSLTELKEALQDFLPASTSPDSLASGLRELESALSQPQQQQRFAWMQPSEEPAATDAEAGAEVAAQQGVGEASQAATDAAAAAAVAPGLGPVADLAGQQAAAGSSYGGSSSSGLRVGAAEYQPSASSVASCLGSLRLQESTSSSQPGRSDALEWGSHSASWASHEAAGWDEQGGSWQDSDGAASSAAAYHWPNAQQAWEGASSAWQGGLAAASAAAAAGEDAAAATERVAGGAAAEAAFLAVLGEQFPLFSADALSQLFAEQGASLAATIHTLCGLEAELEAQQQAAAAAGAARLLDGCSSPEATPAPAFTDDDFPTLGPGRSGTSGRGSSTSNASGASGGGTGSGYVARARAAAQLPSQPPASSCARRPPAGAAAAAGGAASPAPIWQQAEGVARFATGQALASQYAALRSDARDHARLRNAYFQQATQAYLAGNRRLARELGSKGRWHGEQMHAAHQAAASQLFAHRNPGAAAAGGAGGVPTIDLHGLHVAEALQMLEEQLLQLSSSRGSRASAAQRLRVVVGEGKHGKVPARLPAAVRQYLAEQGLPFSQPYAGLLEIRL